MKSFDPAKYSLFIFDLDGVIYKGNRILPFVKETLSQLYSKKNKIAFLTNNSTLTRSSYVNKLKAMKINSEETQIYTSATISASKLKELNPGCSIFVIGEEGLFSALEEQKFRILNNSRNSDLNKIINDIDIKTDAVIIGLDRQITYQKISAAMQLVNRGADFFATNDDPTLPQENGFHPGTGSFVNALATALGQAPDQVFGKPSPLGIKQILKEFNSNEKQTLIIGDRLDTDIASGKNAGVSTLLVLTGSTSKEEAEASNIKSDYIIQDFRAFN